MIAPIPKLLINVELSIESFRETLEKLTPKIIFRDIGTILPENRKKFQSISNYHYTHQFPSQLEYESLLEVILKIVGYA